MPLVPMPNGEVVEVPEGISEEALNRIRQQYQPRRGQEAGPPGRRRRAPLTDEQRDVQRRVATIEENDLQGSDIGRGVERGLFANFADEIRAATSAATFGTVDAVRNMDPSRIGRRYRVERGVQRELDRRAFDRSPVSATVGEIGGAVANPVGTGARAIAGLGRLASATGAERAAAALAGASGRIDRLGAVPQAIIASGNQGALNAAGAAENISEVPGALAQGYGTGALTGGAVGGSVHLGARGAQIIRDALPQNAQRTAYARVAGLLDNANMTPQRAAREIQTANARGGDMMVQDLTPGLRAQAAAISRRPGVPSSNTLIERGEQRIGERAGRFANQVRQTADVPAAGDDALARADSLAGMRRAAGQRDYADGGTMDAPLNWSDDLNNFFRESPDAAGLVRQAYTTAQRFGQPIARLDGDQAIPSMRAFDYLKREFDTQIGMAQRAGNMTLASGLSNQLNRLKGILADANPDYANVLRAQRDLFQQQQALELGQDVLRRLGREPRQVLRDLRKLPDNAVDEARIGIIDALINLDNKADPVAMFRNMSRNTAQREVLEFAFGGRREFRRFQRWVDREVKATRSDVLTAPGRQSETARFLMAADEAHGGIGDVLSNAMRGYAFGGTVGAASGITRTLQNIATGTSRFAQEEIARILLSRGDDLVRGVTEVKAYQKAREASNRRRAIMAGKAGQQMYTDMVGNS